MGWGVAQCTAANEKPSISFQENRIASATEISVTESSRPPLLCIDQLRAGFALPAGFI